MFILNETTNSLYVAGTLTITTMHEINGVVLADKAQYNICLANVDWWLVLWLLVGVGKTTFAQCWPNVAVSGYGN